MEVDHSSAGGVGAGPSNAAADDAGPSNAAAAGAGGSHAASIEIEPCSGAGLGAGPTGAAAADGGELAVAQDLRKLRKRLRENKLFRSQLAQVCGLCIYSMDDQYIAFAWHAWQMCHPRRHAALQVGAKQRDKPQLWGTSGD